MGFKLWIANGARGSEGVNKTIGRNPLSYATDIIIEIKQFNTGRMASHASIKSIWCSHGKIIFFIENGRPKNKAKGKKIIEIHRK